MSWYVGLVVWLNIVSFARSSPFASTVATSSQTHNTSDSSLKVLDTRNTNEYPWVALGDSFAAGPGAGSAWDEYPDTRDCHRNKGAYPPQLNKDFPYPNAAMQFLACTGELVDGMIENQIPDMDFDQQVVTLSIGGNDLKFTNVLKACIFKPPGWINADCDEYIQKTRDIMDNDLKDILYKAYDAVYDNIYPWYTRVMFVQLYPNFFNAETD